MASREEAWAEEKGEDDEDDSSEGIAMCHAMSDPSDFMRPGARQTSRRSCRARQLIFPSEEALDQAKSDDGIPPKPHSATCPDLERHDKQDSRHLTPSPPLGRPPEISSGNRGRRRNFLPVGLQGIRNRLVRRRSKSQMATPSQEAAEAGRTEGERESDPGSPAHYVTEAEADSEAEADFLL